MRLRMIANRIPLIEFPYRVTIELFLFVSVDPILAQWLSRKRLRNFALAFGEIGYYSLWENRIELPILAQWMSPGIMPILSPD